MIKKLQNTFQTLGRFLQKFNQFDLSRWQDWVALVMVLFTFGVVVFRAITEPLIYDEAYTYFNTGRIQDFWQIYQFRIANTHIVNSLAMTVSTLFFPFNDMAIRFPNLLTAAFYFMVAWGVAKKFKNAFFTLGLLISFHFLIELMAMGRGYGMAASFLLATYYVVQYQSLFKKFHITVIVFLLLAFYSNYVSLFPAGMMAFSIWMTQFKFKVPEFTKKQKRWYIGLTLLGIYGFYFVTLEGKPLYGAYHAGFIEAVPYDIADRFLAITSFTLNEILIATLVFTTFVVAIFIRTQKNLAGFITITSLGGIGLIALITGKPLPTGRVLLPFWPFIALGLAEIVEYITPKMSPLKPAVLTANLLGAAWLMFNFSAHIHAEELQQHYATKWYLPIAAMQTFQKELRPEEQYYVEKENYHELFTHQLAAYDKQVKETPLYTATTFPELGLVQLRLKSPEGLTKITRIATGPDTTATGVDVLLPNREVYDYQFVLPNGQTFTQLELIGDNGFKATFRL